MLLVTPGGGIFWSVFLQRVSNNETMVSEDRAILRHLILKYLCGWSNGLLMQVLFRTSLKYSTTQAQFLKISFLFISFIPIFYSKYFCVHNILKFIHVASWHKPCWSRLSAIWSASAEEVCTLWVFLLLCVLFVLVQIFSYHSFTIWNFIEYFCVSVFALVP